MLMSLLFLLIGAGEQPQAAPVQGRLEGRFTAADTGKPVAGATVRVLVAGVPEKPPIVEAVSGADGRYVVDLPVGHASVFGVHAPAGYYTQDPSTYSRILTTSAEPRVVRDFVLQLGLPWRVELHGVNILADKPPMFTAFPNPERESTTSGELIYVTANTQGKAVLTVPNSGGRYRFSCALRTSPETHEIPAATLDLEKDFDPRKTAGDPEPLVGRKGLRLRDAAGRTAVIDGADVAIDAGQAVLRFRALAVPTASAIVLRGAAEDEKGKPLQGVKFTASLANRRSSHMTHLEATTDAQGRFELRDVLLPQAHFQPDSQIQMTAVKSGLHGAETRALNLLDVKKAGSGDFGTVVLKPGRTVRGKVVDENDRPVHGAVVANHARGYVYSHLQCRTDAKGQFVMPDLSFGRQRFWAQYGERSGAGDFNFDAKSGECVITVRLTPKSGLASAPKSGISATARPRPVEPIKDDGVWDLTPPTKEPKYQKEPRYALFVFGAKREQRVWLVLDGQTLYVDRNANGDLTEPDERLEPDNPKDGSNRFGGSGSHTHFDVFDFTVKAGAGGTSTFTFSHWIRDEKYVPKTDIEKKWHAQWLESRHENGTLYRKDGLGQGQTPLIFMPKPADAHVCAFDGPLTFAVKMAEQAVLQRGEAGCDLAFHIVVPGRRYRGSEHALYNRLSTTEPPQGAHLQVDIEYPSKAPIAEPVRRKYLLKQRC